ncbi:TPA: hypothetical protein IAA91_04465, partial [Candidatus Avacholeplasma faecigallinarum]|nr:hypothetical protein [Candidatus Avacholeplasma faecigallinarum]
MMEYITLKRLGLDHYNIDMTKSYELFNPDTNNHTIVLYLNKENKTYCPYCNSTEIKSKGTRSISFNYSIN